MKNIYTYKKTALKQGRFFKALQFLFAVVFTCFSLKASAEGSEQFRPDTTKVTALMILNTQPTYGTFASYSATDTNRLFIHINNPAIEKIYFGMGGRSTNNNWYFRIKNPNGTIIYGPTLLPTSAAGQGFIQYYKQAILGPNVVNAQGYNGFAITPTAGLSGNYYIEFNEGSGTNESFNTEIDFEKFDISVVNTSSNTEIPGRVFSYNWSFNTSSYANPFFGSFYIYGADSSITKVDMNGIKPYKFRVSCNSWGTSKTGNATTDRRSKLGFAVPPQLRLFLRDADQTAYPSGSMIFFTGPVTLTRCVKDSICININLTRVSDITIFIDRNGNGVYNPGTADIKLFYPQTPAGPNCLFWNAKDGLGNYITPGSSLSVTVSIQNGEVDLPMFDIENNETGYTMSVIRPGAGIFVDSLFYDDQLVGGATNLTGCAFPCHTWASNPVNSESNTIGNNNTMNSWWFAHSSSSLMSMTMPDYLVTSAGANQSKCVIGSNQDTVQLAGSIDYSISAYNGSKIWTTTGTGTFSPNDTLYNSKYIPSAADITAGSVTFYLGPRFGCSTPDDTVVITLKKSPQLSSSITNVNCFSQATGGVTLSVTNSTSPYTFNWSNGYTTQNLTNVVAGSYTVTVTSANGCTRVTNATITQPASAISAVLTSSGNVSCNGGANGAINITASGGTAPYTYNWNNGATTQDLSSVTAGTYTVTVSDANGCNSTVASISITQPSASLNSSTGSTTNVSCNGGNNGAINLNVTGGTSPYTYNWSNGSTAQDLTNIASGTYSVTVTDANGCTDATMGISISQPGSALSASASATNNVSCFGGTNGSINLSVSGGTSPYTFNWSNGAATQNLTNITAGTYSVTVTDAQGCTKVVSAVSITQPAGALSSNVNSSNNVSCFGGTNGNITLNVTGGTSPYSYNWSNGTSTQNITNVVAGTYAVTVTDNQGCTTANSGISITQPPAALSSNASSVSNVSCFGGNNGSVNLNVSGGTVPYSYNWSNGSVSQDLTNVPAGNYSVIITDAHGCTTSTSGVTITQPAATLASTNSHVNVLCRNNTTGSINIIVTGGTAPYSYDWSNGANTEDLSGISAGTYTVTITDNNGCTSTSAAITVTQPAAVLAGAATTTGNVACNSGANGTVNLTVTGGTAPYTYNWSNGATTQDIGGLFAGNYVVTITDANGCSASSASTVSQPSGALSSSINTSQNVSCYGGSNGSINLTVSGGTTPYSYNWSDGSTTQDISGLNSGSYTVTVTDGNGCINISTAIVTQPSGSLSSNASSTNAVSCFGGSDGTINLSVTGGTTPYSFNWSNGSNNQNLTGLTAGNYSVTVTDANGCTTQTSAITISQPGAALSSSAASTNNVSCFGGTNGAINLTVTGGTLPYSYSWSTGDNTQDLTNLSAGNYSVTVTDANGCTTQTSAITISQPPAALSSSASSSNNVSCFGGTNGSITLSVSGGTSPYSYNWSNGAVSQNLSNIPAGTYSVVITDAHGCTSATSGVAISQPSASLSSSVSTTNNVSCFGGANGAINLNVNGGTLPYSYSWSSGATTQNLNNVLAGTYTVTITDAHGCTASNSGLQITQPGAALNSSAASTSDVSCNGGTNGGITMTVTGGTLPYTYQWNNGTTTQNLSNISAGNYTVTVTDLNGCTTSVSAISITEPAAALSSLVNATNDVSCFGGTNGTVTLNVTGGTTPYTFNWSNGTHSQNLSNVNAGTYSVTVIDVNGCSTSSSGIVISQPANPLTASVSASQNVSCYSGANGLINLAVSGGTGPYTYNWSNGANTQDISGLSSGTYTVTITDENGCTFNQFASISQPSSALSASASVSQNVSCFGGSNASINLNANGGTTPYSYLWSNGSSTQNVNNISSGTYTVTITDANGCTANQTKTVTQPSNALSASSSVSQNVSCFFGSNGAINASASGGTSPYSFLWNNGATSQNISSLSAGAFTVIITDANGCTTSQSQVITQPSSGLSAAATVSQDVSCFAGTNGSVNLNVIGGTAPYTYNWSNSSTTQSINNLSAGTYTVSITDANGCLYSTNATIIQPSSGISASANVTQNVSCNGGANGSIDLTVSGGTVPYTYDWSNSSTTQDLSNLSAGIYTVAITDANGCTYLQGGTITEPAASLAASSTVTANISCFSGNNGSVDLSVSGGTSPYSYSWNTGASSQDLTGLSAGTYSVTVTDANGCTALNTAVILQPAGALSSSITVTSSVLCHGGNAGTIDLSVSGGTTPYTYNWSNGATTEDLSGLAAGTYSATITDANGCFSSVTGTVTQPASALGANISVTQNVSCNSGANGALSLAVSGGTAPYAYNWSNGATTQNISNLASGTYSVSITDANGCTETATGTITQPAGSLSALALVSQNVSCYSGANGSIDLTVNGGTPPYTYSWSNGANIEDISGLISGTYIVNITDANGCTTSQSAVVMQPSGSLTATASTTQNVSCFGGANGTIDLTVNGGTSPYSFSWSNGASTEDISNLSTGIYTVNITDGNGCTFIQNGTISQPSGSLTANANVTQNVSCNSGANGAISLSVTGGTLPYSYNWSNGTTNQNLNNLSAGTYTVTITDANGCSAIQTQTVSQPSGALSATSAASQNVSCFGGSNGSITLTVTGGTIPYSYNWSNSSTTQNLGNLSSGSYTVTITDANGCTASQTQSITQPSASLSATSSANQNVSCFGGTNGSVMLNVTGGTSPYTFNWSNGASTQNISNLASGTYTVTVTDANGCTANQSQSISQPSASLSASTAASQNVFCFGGVNGSVSLTVSGGTSPYSYNWSNGATTQNVSALTSGTYTVTVTDANGCTAIETQNITQPSASLSATSAVNNQVSCFGGANGSVNLTVSGGTAPYSYSWSNGANTEDINGLSAGNYTVTITDANGCTTVSNAAITQPSGSLSATISASQNVSCNSGSNGSVSVVVTGGTSPYMYDWSNGASTQNINNLNAGTYTITITDGNGCTTIQTATVTQPSAALSATSSANQNVSCYGGVNGAITLNVSGGTAPYSYNWSNGATIQNISNLIAGTYSVTVTDANGCTANQSQVITQPSAGLSASANVSQNVSCFGGNDATINLTVNGGTTPYIFNWSNGAATQNISNLAAGTYTVTITDANACTDEQTITITQPSAGLSASSTVTSNISCFSGNNGTIDLTVNGGTAPYSYSWNTGATTEDLSGLSAGNYSVTVTDANGCTTTNNAVITQPIGSLSTSISLTQGVLCNGGNNGSIDITVSGGTPPYTYNWSNGATTEDISNLSAGVFTATITDANGCFASVTGTITQPSASLSATASVTQNVSCFAGGNGTIDLTVNGGTSPYSYTWSNSATTEDINNLSAGTYTVSITDANGCTFTQNATVTQPSGTLSASASITQNVSCYAGANGAIDLTVNGGTSPYNFNWSNGSTTEDIGNLSAGTYVVSITDANGCTFSQSGTITQPGGALSSSASTTQNVSCFAGGNGAIDLTVNGGTVPYTYNWSNAATSEDISNLSAGTYTVSITDANGCTAVQTGAISQPLDSLSSNTIVTGNISCFSGNNGSIDLTVSGGTMPYSYVWNTGATTEDIINLSAGTYSVSIIDANGCTTNSIAIITQPAGALATNVSINQQVSCYAGSNGSIDLTVTGGTLPYTFTWSNGSTTEDISNLSAGIYTVMVNDSNGCNASVIATITQPAAALNASANITQNINCYAGNNGSIDLTSADGTVPYSYIWSNGLTTEDISGLTSGTYTVTVTDANGCTTTTSATISQPTGALNAGLNVTQNVSCYTGTNGSIDLTASDGTAPYAFNWSNGATTEDINNLAAGTYTVTVTDANGCTTTASSTVTQPSASLSASTNVTQNVSCHSGNNGAVNLTVTNGTAPYSYSWNNGSTSEDISNLVSGTYTVTVTDANGCTTVVSATITQPAASLNAAANVSQNISCYSGTNGSIALTVNGGTSPYSYNWSNGATTQNLNGLAAGNYSVTITDVNGCTTTVTAAVTQPSASLSANASVSQNVNCNSGTNGAINLTVNGGTSPYSFNWSNSATTEDLSNLSAGTYSVTITDDNGCTQSVSATVTQPSNALTAAASVTQTVSCFGGNNGSVALTVNGGTTPYSYNWSNGTNTQNLTNVSQGTYIVTITDANGCTQSASATVTAPSASISVNGSGSTANCLGGITGNITINVNGGTSPFSYQWNNGNTTQNLNNQAAGTYTVTVTDANNCTTNGSFVITDQSALNANAAGPSDICIGELAMLVADSIPGATYQWYIDGQILTGSNSNIFITPAAGSYTVTVSNSCGTFTSDSMVIKVHTIDNISISPNVIICPGESTQLNVTGGVSYEWTPTNGLSYANIPNPIASPTVTTQYVVTITNEYGCKTTGEIQVGVLCDTLIIPSGFSPNEDVINDAFVIKGIEHYPGNKIWIYNRWGNLVYKAHEYNNGWNGVSNVSGIYIGKKVPAGTYFYVLDLNNKTKPLQGYIVMKY